MSVKYDVDRFLINESPRDIKRRGYVVDVTYQMDLQYQLRKMTELNINSKMDQQQIQQQYEYELLKCAQLNSMHSSMQQQQQAELPDSCLEQYGESGEVRPDASKDRRKKINDAIHELCQTLRITESARNKLTQLQVLCLSCVTIRMSHYFRELIPKDHHSNDSFPPFDPLEGLPGFLLIMARDGKLLYISDNITQYIGHSMVDLLTQGDDIKDIVDTKDYNLVMTELSNPVAREGGSDERSFCCSLNLAKKLRRQAGHSDQKVMHIRGRFLVSASPTEGKFGWNEIFVGICSPLVSPEIKDCMIPVSTKIFRSVHRLSMNYVEIAPLGEYYFGYTNQEIQSMSWYQLLDPRYIKNARNIHEQLLRPGKPSCMLTVMMLNKSGQRVALNVVMQVGNLYLQEDKEGCIFCINEIIDEDEMEMFNRFSLTHNTQRAHSPEMVDPSSGGNCIRIEPTPWVQVAQYNSHQMQGENYYNPNYQAPFHYYHHPEFYVQHHQQLEVSPYQQTIEYHENYPVDQVHPVTAELAHLRSPVPYQNEVPYMPHRQLIVQHAQSEQQRDPQLFKNEAMFKRYKLDTTDKLFRELRSLDPVFVQDYFEQEKHVKNDSLHDTNNRNRTIDYGTNFAQPHYEQIMPSSNLKTLNGYHGYNTNYIHRNLRDLASFPHHLENGHERLFYRRNSDGIASDFESDVGSPEGSS